MKKTAIKMKVLSSHPGPDGKWLGPGKTYDVPNLAKALELERIGRAERVASGGAQSAAAKDTDPAK